VLFDNVDTAKMHGLDTSNVSSRVESSQVEFGLYLARTNTESGCGNLENSYANVVRTTSFSTGVIPHTAVCERTQVCDATLLITSYTYNMAAASIADRMTSRSPRV